MVLPFLGLLTWISRDNICQFYRIGGLIRPGQQTFFHLPPFFFKVSRMGKALACPSTQKQSKMGTALPLPILPAENLQYLLIGFILPGQQIFFHPAPLDRNVFLSY
ncbi:MAG: hypothetical protein RLZZ419_587 [Pseudomonadota bacterium]|jgi:hypothetical protein